MSKEDIKHTARINEIDYKIIEVQNKYIVAKPIENITPSSTSGAHICFNTGNHHYDNFDGSKPVYINQYYNQTGSIFIASGSYVAELSIKDNDLILLPKRPVSELNYSQENGNLRLSVNADGWVVALAKNKETIGEVQDKINKYVKENLENKEEGWKLKICEFCNKEYIKGTGITKVELWDKNKIIDCDDSKYIGFEGIEELNPKSETSGCILCFCSKECCEKYFNIENNK
jgi:ribosomal protein L24E